MRRADERDMVPGAALVLGIPADAVTSAQPRIVAWRLVELDTRGGFIEHGPAFRRRSDAQHFGSTVFPHVVRWRRVAFDRFLGKAAEPAATGLPLTSVESA